MTTERFDASLPIYALVLDPDRQASTVTVDLLSSLRRDHPSLRAMTTIAVRSRREEVNSLSSLGLWPSNARAAPLALVVIEQSLGDCSPEFWGRGDESYRGIEGVAFTVQLTAELGISPKVIALTNRKGTSDDAGFEFAKAGAHAYVSKSTDRTTVAMTMLRFLEDFMRMHAISKQ